jgi:hypothetical protein
MLWYGEFESNMTVQHNFQHTYGTEAPSDKAITWWCTEFKEEGSAEKQKSTGRPQTSKQ